MKRALVTGASGDIGAAICSRFAQEGLHVIAHAHTRPQLAEDVIREVRHLGQSGETVVFDVTDSGETQRQIQALLESGPIQVLVNNAGIHSDAPMAGMTYEQWRQVIDVSLHGFFNATRPLLMEMMGTRWGRIINISSISGVIGNRGQANYAAAKAGLHGATLSLAQELASRGITVNTVAPGLIDTRMTRETFDTAAIKKLVPMKRAGTPHELAAVVNFLASEEAGYLSGQIISVNGAMA